MRERRRIDRRALRSDPMAFGDVRNWIAEVARAAGQDGAWGRRFALALHEAITNVHRHSYDGRLDGRIDIRAETRDDAIEVRVRDYGRPIGPVPTDVPDPARPSESGGYGVALIRASVDEVRYAAVAHGTEVVLVKRREESGTPAASGGPGRGACS